ncbi:relaxase domain-containing protein [Streptomyces sp. NPDC002690]
MVATWRHRDRRDGFPLPHDHCLVLNRAQRPDGSWYALDTVRLYRNVVAWVGLGPRCSSVLHRRPKPGARRRSRGSRRPGASTSLISPLNDEPGSLSRPHSCCLLSGGVSTLA